MDDPNAITIEVPGATAEQMARGLAAALAVFQAGGCTADEAAYADVLRERLHEGGYYDAGGNFADPLAGQPLFEGEIRLGDMTDRQVQIAPLCGDSATLEACCAAWPAERRPASVGCL